MKSPTLIQTTYVVSFTLGAAFGLLLATPSRAAESSLPDRAGPLGLVSAPTTGESEPGKIAPYRARFGRSRPVIAVIGENRGTETVDFVVPYGILAQAGVAEVVAVATRPGPMQMFPALRIDPQATIAGFDERFPDGADYVIVPAVQHNDDPALLAWISAQAAKGATVASICDGALVLGNTGLLKGHRATGHWFTHDRRVKKYPETRWLKNTRYVADGAIVTTSGVTAAVPFSVALIEAIAGQAKAAEVAAQLGLRDWSPAHNSEPYHLTSGRLALTVGHKLAFWSHETVGVPVADGVDEVTLALVADAYTRTFRSQARTVAATREPIRTRGGLVILPDKVSGADRAVDVDRMLPEFGPVPAMTEFDQTLASLAVVYGRKTASWIAVQLEYPQP